MSKGKKPSSKKSLEQRHAEIDDALIQLQGLGLTPEMEGVDEFMKIVNDFFDKGIHASGDIIVKGTKRRIVYKLSMQPHIACSIMLKHDPFA